jgi:GAF domain-containing protein
MAARRQHLEQGLDPGFAVLRARARHASRISLLQGITAALSRAVTRDDVARTLIERTLAALRAQEGGLWSLDAGASEARLLFGAGFDAAARSRWERVPLGGDAPAPLAEVLLRGEPVFVGSRAESEARWPDAVPRRRGGRVQDDHAFVCLPLEAEGRVIGGLSFLFRHPHRFDYDEQVFLLVVARLAAQALLRAELYDSERAARAEAEAARQRATFLAEAARSSPRHSRGRRRSRASRSPPGPASRTGARSRSRRRSRPTPCPWRWPTWIRRRWRGRSSGGSAGPPIPTRPPARRR